ncbi:hypothetical protein [Polymorphobacter sp.]|uniref:hypothetical protein n=1 Tax=Polymorphobacter sp. TaxID=1909290 RepID=UPI003F6FB2A0
MLMTIKPEMKSWLILLFPTAPIFAIGIYVFVGGAWFGGACSIIFGIICILYNASLRIIIDNEFIMLRRYGLQVWRMSKRGTIIVAGKGGDFNILPAYVLQNVQNNESNYILKSWISDEKIKQIESLLA